MSVLYCIQSFDNKTWIFIQMRGDRYNSNIQYFNNLEFNYILIWKILWFGHQQFEETFYTTVAKQSHFYLLTTEKVESREWLKFLKYFLNILLTITRHVVGNWVSCIYHIKDGEI